MAVRMKPFGSLLSPGIMNLAITPTIKPMRIVQRMLMSCSCLDPALGANRALLYNGLRATGTTPDRPDGVGGCTASTGAWWNDGTRPCPGHAKQSDRIRAGAGFDLHQAGELLRVELVLFGPRKPAQPSVHQHLSARGG